MHHFFVVIFVCGSSFTRAGRCTTTLFAHLVAGSPAEETQSELLQSGPPILSAPVSALGQHQYTPKLVAPWGLAPYNRVPTTAETRPYSQLYQGPSLRTCVPRASTAQPQQEDTYIPHRGHSWSTWLWRPEDCITGPHNNTRGLLTPHLHEWIDHPDRKTLRKLWP